MSAVLTRSMAFRIGKVEIGTNAVLAPLAGFTDLAFRSICRRFGAGLTYTEMVSAKGLVYGNENTAGLLATADNEVPSAVQIFGSEPEFISRAVESLSGFDIIDINMGCPVPKIVKNGEGSALMRTPEVAEAVVRAAVRATDKPVTVKFRRGFGEKDDTCVEFAKRMEGAGAAAVTVHGRTREQFYAGTADWQAISRVAAAVKIPVIGNGDVVDRKSYLAAMETGVDAVMVGRGALGAPWVFAEMLGLQQEYNRFDIAREHLTRLLEQFPAICVVGNMKKHLARYMKGLRGVAGYKDKIYSARTTKQLMDVIDEAEADNVR